jgi:hypothetical protein
MKILVLALPFFAMSAAAWAGDDPCLPTRMSLDEEPRERQDLENERQRPDDSSRLTPVEFVFRHSGLEAGVLYQDFDSGLSLKSHLAYYVRWAVEVAPHVLFHASYRYNAFGNGDRADQAGEDVVVQSLLFGAMYVQPLMRDFALEGSVAIGPTWWTSNVFKSDMGFTVSGELAVTARLWELLRFKAGLVVDASSTSFHSASGMQVSPAWLFGFEYGL